MGLVAWWLETGLGFLLILETGLGLSVGNGFSGVVVGNGFGFADLGLGLPISVWVCRSRRGGLPILTWVCCLQLGRVVVVTGGEKRRRKEK
jgi:hypothetical protein